MKDPEIRKVLIHTELQKYINDPFSRVVQELKIPVANARIDMAVINGDFHGFEIKSAADTLKRLPNQLAAYEHVFDYLTVITEEKYCKKILDLIPDWVGVKACLAHEGCARLQDVKPSSRNNNKNGFYLAKLLLNEELVQLLSALKIPFKAKDRNWTLCEILSSNIDIITLSDLVKSTLKARIKKV